MKAEEYWDKVKRMTVNGVKPIHHDEFIEMLTDFAKQYCEAQRIACAENARTKDEIIRSSEHPDFDYAEVDKQSILETPLVI